MLTASLSPPPPSLFPEPEAPTQGHSTPPCPPPTLCGSLIPREDARSVLSGGRRCPFSVSPHAPPPPGGVRRTAGGLTRGLSASCGRHCAQTKGERPGTWAPATRARGWGVQHESHRPTPRTRVTTHTRTSRSTPFLWDAPRNGGPPVAILDPDRVVVPGCPRGGGV